MRARARRFDQTGVDLTTLWTNPSHAARPVRAQRRAEFVSVIFDAQRLLEVVALLNDSPIPRHSSFRHAAVGKEHDDPAQETEAVGRADRHIADDSTVQDL